jgi:hypothetical protein
LHTLSFASLSGFVTAPVRILLQKTHQYSYLYNLLNIQYSLSILRGTDVGFAGGQPDSWCSLWNLCHRRKLYWSGIRARYIARLWSPHPGSHFFTLNQAGLALVETNSSGTLVGMSITNGFDSKLRRTSLTFRKSGSTADFSHAYGYDAASRMSSVSDGTLSAAYTYIANSPLIGQITSVPGSIPLERK